MRWLGDIVRPWVARQIRWRLLPTIEQPFEELADEVRRLIDLGQFTAADQVLDVLETGTWGFHPEIIRLRWLNDDALLEALGDD